MEMIEKTWQNPYSATSDSSLPPSRRLSPCRLVELNRPRWGGVWGQETSSSDPPPPSWLSRLGQSSQVILVESFVNLFQHLQFVRNKFQTLLRV